MRVPATVLIRRLARGPTAYLVEKNPFAGDFDDKPGANSLAVKLAGEEVFATTEILAAGKPIRVERIERLKSGKNELFLTGNLTAEQSNRANAIRVRVFRDGNFDQEVTLWSDPGGALKGSVWIDADALIESEEPHDHD